MQIAAFRRCLDEYTSGRVSSSAGDSRVVTEAGQRPQLTLTFQQDSRFAALKNLNAQKRGERMQPLAFAEPGSTADAAAVVKCSVTAGLRFTARNGGHHYEANSLLDGGVVIDLVKLQELKVNKQDNSVVIGAGQKLVRTVNTSTVLTHCNGSNHG
jgi:FAD/FMN-containing dehydrogenase